MSITTQDTIRRIANDSPNRLAFYQQFLPFVVNQTGAVSAIAWKCTSLPFRPLCQLQSPSHETLRIGVSETEHVDLLNRGIQSQYALVIKPKVTNPLTNSNSATIENPYIVLASVRQNESVEIIELFFPQGSDADVYQSHSETLNNFCQIAADSDLPDETVTQGPPRTTAPSVKKISPSQLDNYVHQVHRSLDPTETSQRIVNEARRLLDCDRVSVVQIKGGRCKIKSISGQPSINNRSNTVQLLRQLCDRVLPTRQSFWYPSDKQLPVEIETPLQNYLAIAVTRSLIVEPIFDRPPEQQERPDIVNKQPRLIGGLVIENCKQEWTKDSVSQAMDVAVRHASDAYRNAHTHRQLLFYPVWKWLGKSKAIYAARNLPKTLAAAIGLLALGLLLAFCPADLKVSCEGVLIPAHRQNVFAPIDGTVGQISVEHGSTVKSGDPLMRLINIDLETQSAELAGKINELERNIESTETLLLSRSLTDDQLGEQNLNAQKEELASYHRQRDLINQKLAKLEINSPMAGQVVTWNLDDRFKMRPVSRGDLLMEVVDIEGDWQLELNLPDQKVGHLLDAHHNSKTPLTVEFILAADPDRKLAGKLIDIGHATEIEPEKGQSVRLKVKIDSRDLDIRQAKSGVTANVICRKTTLGNSLFLGAKEFFQKHWFRLF